MRKHLKDYFIPHEGNDYAPHSLQKAAMTGMVLLVLLSFTLANVQSFLWVASDWMVSTILPAVIVDLTNDERSDVALGQLTRNPSLDTAAQFKAQHMAEKEYFAHFSPGGVSPWFWFAQADYNFVHAGENLAIHFTDTGELVDAWMDSPTHRANIVNGNYTEIGIGTAEGEFEGYKTVYVVQLFGTPAATQAQSVVAGSGVSGAQASEPAAADETTPEREFDNTQQEVLAESVEITQDVVIVEAESTPLATAQESEIAEETEEEIVLAIPPSFVSTSTGGIPASIDPAETQVTTDTSTPYFYKMLTQPHIALQAMYVAIGLVVLASLVFSVLIEIRRQHPIQIAYSLALLLLMFGLFRLHETLSAGAIIV
jgi:hypothetical protein